MGLERYSTSESEESLLEDQRLSTKWNQSTSTPPRRRGAWVLTVFNVLLFCFSAVMLVESRYGLILGSGKAWLRETSYYSPLWGSDVEAQLHKDDKLTDGSIFETANPSRFRNALKPDEAVDAAWQELEIIRTFPITADDVRGLGKDPELAARFPPEYGFGDDAYVAQLDIFHQLHCLNLLRHIAWNEYDRDGKTAKHPYSDLHWIHVSHCTEILAQNLMCSANLDVITFNWVQTQDLPFADFNLNKKCTNVDALIAWQQDHAVSPGKARNFTRPAGAKEIPISDEYFRIFGVEKVDLHPGEAHEHAMKDEPVQE